MPTVIYYHWCSWLNWSCIAVYLTINVSEDKVFYYDIVSWNNLKLNHSKMCHSLCCKRVRKCVVSWTAAILRIGGNIYYTRCDEASFSYSVTHLFFTLGGNEMKYKQVRKRLKFDGQRSALSKHFQRCHWHSQCWYFENVAKCELNVSENSW